MSPCVRGETAHGLVRPLAAYQSPRPRTGLAKVIPVTNAARKLYEMTENTHEYRMSTWRDSGGVEGQSDTLPGVVARRAWRSRKTQMRQKGRCVAKSLTRQWGSSACAWSRSRPYRLAIRYKLRRLIPRIWAACFLFPWVARSTA
jgi:hypothetical protein